MFRRFNFRGFSKNRKICEKIEPREKRRLTVRLERVLRTACLENKATEVGSTCTSGWVGQVSPHSSYVNETM